MSENPQDNHRQSVTSESYDNPSASSRGQYLLASKVNSILSMSYADSDIKDALCILDTRGLSNTNATRRQLRYDIQKEVIKSNGFIIEELGYVSAQLKKIGATIVRLNESCKEIKSYVSNAQDESASTLEQASSLLTEKDQVETKEQLVKAFNAHFILSDDELSILSSSAMSVDDEFFMVFYKAKKIQKDCEILLGTENQRLGLEIMEQVSSSLNSAFQKLFRWIQLEFKYLNLENPQITSSIRRALRVLAERPSLFQRSLDYFAETRDSTLSDSFYSALSGSSLIGEHRLSVVKPIELTAHDPLRYIGDMLAWIHSATVSEKEALEVLFVSDGAEIAKGIEVGRKSEPWSQLSEDDGDTFDFDGKRALNELLDHDFNGVTSVLRQRVGQLIQSHEESITAYKIVNLLNFYHVTFSKLLDEDAGLVKSLFSLEESAYRQFRMLMKDQVANLQQDTQIVPESFGPPEFLYDSFKQLTAIMKTYETSLATVNSREIDFKPILDDAFEPFISRCEEMAIDLMIPNNSIFLINCLVAAAKTLSPFDFAKQRLFFIQKYIDMHAARLVDYQYSYIQEKSGLRPISQALASVSYSEQDLRAIRSLEPLQLDFLEKASDTLDQFLPSALIDVIQNLKNLKDSSFARMITEEAVEKFCVDFEQIEKKMIAADQIWKQEEDKMDSVSLRTIFPRTSGDLRVLLS
ncbi:Conserved oligomeric Golgi complex subunit 6 [Erysiphe neolycopersici]|uniref:Conserved oligomeric Golgi complex subunit 6 n=1 Tax=Erysiphe neolycopersici TaxID=212602 RepID=A0A420HVH5_9PEZI|nr:Conserved oligomeric Golgi complex subunit 6 [Erysiphe neolycopersici]